MYVGTLQQYIDVSYLMFEIMFMQWYQYNTLSNGKRGRETHAGLWAPYLVHKCIAYKYNQCGVQEVQGATLIFHIPVICICERC